MKKLILLVLLGITSLVSPLSSQAETELTKENIEGFVKTLRPLQTYSRSPESGYLSDLFKSSMISDGLSSGIYSEVISSLKKLDPQTVSELKKIVTQNGGFSSLNEWAEVGDKVMMAFVAITVEPHYGELEKAMKIEPEVLAKMPERMKKRLVQLQEVYTQTRNVPDSLKDMVRPYLEELQRSAPQPKKALPKQ